MERISIELADDMTLGTLRSLAQSMGKRLVVSFAGGARRKVEEPAAPAPRARKGRRRRKLSPEGRAALARNLAKARAVRSAKLKAARKGKEASA